MAKFPKLVIDILDPVLSPSLARLGEEVRGRGGEEVRSAGEGGLHRL